MGVVNELWEVYDKDGSGALSDQELREFMKDTMRELTGEPDY